MFITTEEFNTEQEKLLKIDDFQEAIRKAVWICRNVPMYEEAKSKLVTKPYVHTVYERLGTKTADEYYKPNRARQIEVYACVDLKLSKKATEHLKICLENKKVLIIDGETLMPMNYSTPDPTCPGAPYITQYYEIAEKETY